MKKILSWMLLVMMAGTSVKAQNEAEDGMTDARLPIENLTMQESAQSGSLRIGKRGEPLPCEGAPRIPVLLVQFPDLPFTVKESAEEVNVLYHYDFNGKEPGVIYSEGRSAYSVRDYFVGMSDSLLLPEFDVYGPVTLSQSYTYYGEDSKDAYGNVTHDIHIREFYREACSAFFANSDKSVADFDSNQDGKVDMIFFIYAGEGQNATDAFDANTIWPKESATTITINIDGQDVKIGAFGCTNELLCARDADGNVTLSVQDGIGAACHELSHGLGLCDLYDTKGLLYGMDYWDLMDTGCYSRSARNPCGFSAYERDFMGWRMLEDLPLGADTTLILAPVAMGGLGYRLVDPQDENHYFILENRQNQGFDSYLGAVGTTVQGIRLQGNTHGLMVTEVKYDASRWYSNKVNDGILRLTLWQANRGKLISHLKNGYTQEYVEAQLRAMLPGADQESQLELLGQSLSIDEQPSDDYPEPTNVINLHLNNGSSINKVRADKGEPRLFDLMGRRVLHPVAGHLYITR